MVSEKESEFPNAGQQSCKTNQAYQVCDEDNNCTNYYLPKCGIIISINYIFFSTGWWLYTLVFFLNFILFRIPEQSNDAVIKIKYKKDNTVREAKFHFKGISSSNFAVIYECTVDMVKADKENENGFDNKLVSLGEAITLPLGTTNLDVCMNKILVPF